MGGVQCCGQQPIINQDVWHPSIDDGEFEKAQSQDQQQKQNEVQNDEKKEVNDQEKTATEVEEHFDDDLKSIIEKKSIEFQAPDTTYAIPLQKSEEEFYLPTQRMQQYIKQHWKEINLTLIDKIQYLPYQDIPYKVLIDNSIFIGTWYKGYPEGYGKFTYIINHEQEVGKQQDIKTRDNKTKITRIYEGMVRNGQPHGMGRSLNRQLTCYAGQWRNGMMEGDGELSKIDGFIYKGNFKMNKPHGQGLEKWPNGIVYNGQYSQGKKCGKGRLIWPMPKRDQKELKDIKVTEPQTEENDQLNKMPGTQGEQENQNLGEQQNKNEEQQEVYDGEFLDNLYHGKGIYNWKDGRTYNGEWVKGKMEGKGKFTWKQDSYYDGEYKNDLKDGYGEFHFNATCCWKGQWKKGKQDGKGKLCVNDVEYEGIWKEGKRVQWIIGPSSSSKFGNFSAINPIRNETSTIKQSDIGFGQSKNIDLNINPFDQSKLSQQIPVTTQNNQVDFSKVFNSNNTQPKEINLNDLYTSKFTGQPESVLFDKQYANQTADFNNGLINDSNNFGINKNNFNINYLDTNNNNFGSSTQNNNFNIQAQQPLIESKEQLQPNTFKSPKEFEELQVKDEHSKQNYDMGNQQQDQHENPQIDQKLTFQKDNVFHDQPIIQNQSQAEKQPQNKNYQSLFQQENAQPKIEQQLQQIHQNIFIHQPQIQTQQSQTEATHQQPILQPQVQVPSQSYMQPEIKPTQQAEPLQQQQFQPQQNMLSQNLPQNQVENQYQQQNQPNQQVTTNQQLQSQDQQQQQIQDLQLQQQFQQQQPHQEKTFEQQQQTIQPKPNFSLQQYQDQVQTQNNDHQNAQDKQQNSDLPKIKLSQGMMGDTQNNHPNQLSPDQLLVQQQEQELQLHQQQPQDLQQQQQQNQSQDQAYIFYSQNQSKEAVQIQQNVQLQQQQIGLLNFDTQKSDKNKNQKEIDEQSKNISNQIDQDSRILKFDQQQQQKPQEVLLENLVSDFTAKDNNQQPKMKNAVEN